MPLFANTRGAYRNGRLKVDTQQIQSQKFCVTAEVDALLDEQLEKARAEAPSAPAAANPATPAAANPTPAADTPTRKATNLGRFMLMRRREIAKGLAFSYDDMGGGVCHGLVYAWFQSLEQGATTLDFNVDQGRWADRIQSIATQARRNQARLNARVIERNHKSDDAALRKAGERLAKESGFDEQELANSGTDAACVDRVLEQIAVLEHPVCYRLSITVVGGKHSIGLVRKGATYWLLDPNVGILEYARRADLRADLVVVLGPGDSGYGASSMRVLKAEPPPRTEADDLDALLKSFVTA